VILKIAENYQLHYIIHKLHEITSVTRRIYIYNYICNCICTQFALQN